MNLFDMFYKSYKEIRTRLEIPVMPVDSSGVEKFTAANPATVALKDGEVAIDGSAPVVLAKGVTDAAGTTSQFADGTKNFETGAFVGKMAKLTIDEIDYYRTILTNTGGTVIINPIVDAVKAKAIIGEVSGGQVTVEYDTAGSAGNDFSVQYVPIVINSLPTAAQLIAESGLIVVSLGTGADGLAASTTIGSGADGVVTITYYTEGTIGNSYTVEAVLAGEASADMAVDLDTSGLTPKLIITLGTDGDGLIDASKNTAALVAAQIDALNTLTATASGNGSTAIAVTAEKNLENGTDPTIIATGSDVATAISLIEGFTATMTGAGGTVAPTTEDVSFTGGIDAITIPSGTEYEILDYGLVNKFVPTDTDGDEKFTAANPAVMSLYGSYLVQDAVIAQNETDSTEVDIQKWKYISILMPAGWDAATLTIKGSAVAGGTKRTIKNDVGQTFPAMTVAVDTIYTIDANALMLAGVHFITFVASAAQTTAARTIKVMCKA